MLESGENATVGAITDEPGTAAGEKQTQPVTPNEPAPSVKKPASGDAFTKEDVDRIKSAQFTAGKTSLLKELGINEPGKDPATQIAEFKAWKDSQKTEAEKAQSKISALTSELTAAQASVALFEKKMAAIAAGVPTDKVDRYIKLAEASDGEGTFETKLAATIEEFPLPKAQVPKIVTGQSKQGTGTTATFTMEQIAQMSQADINKNWAAIQASLAANKKG